MSPSLIEAESLLTPTAIVGYRMWRLGTDTVRGLHGGVWREPMMTASCRSGDLAPSPHLDEAGCGGMCGIHAFASAQGLLRAAHQVAGPKRLTASSTDVGTPIPEALYGTVALSGRVIEHERGFRAERARIVRLAYVHGLQIETTTEATTIAGQFPYPAAARRSFDDMLHVGSAQELPAVVARFLTPG